MEKNLESFVFGVLMGLYLNRTYCEDCGCVVGRCEEGLSRFGYWVPNEVCFSPHLSILSFRVGTQSKQGEITSSLFFASLYHILHFSTLDTHSDLCSYHPSRTNFVILVEHSRVSTTQESGISVNYISLFFSL